MSHSQDFLDAETLHALGRFAWTAMNVDWNARDICEHVLEKRWSREPTGLLIRQALENLQQREQGVVTQLGIKFLSESKEALNTRNQILHSIPGQVFASTPSTKLLIHVSPNGAESTVIPLEPQVFHGYADSFEQIYAFQPIALRNLLALSSESREEFEAAMRSGTDGDGEYFTPTG